MFIDIEELTIEDVIVEGMKLWYWLYRNPEEYKSGYPGWNIILDRLDDIENECFPCTYCKTVCTRCPLDSYYCQGGDGDIFEKWEDSILYKHSRSKYAWQMIEGHFEIKLPYDIGE